MVYFVGDYFFFMEWYIIFSSLFLNKSWSQAGNNQPDIANYMNSYKLLGCFLKCQTRKKPKQSAIAEKSEIVRMIAAIRHLSPTKLPLMYGPSRIWDTLLIAIVGALFLGNSSTSIIKMNTKFT